MYGNINLKTVSQMTMGSIMLFDQQWLMDVGIFFWAQLGQCVETDQDLVWNTGTCSFAAIYVQLDVALLERMIFLGVATQSIMPLEYGHQDIAQPVGPRSRQWLPEPASSKQGAIWSTKVWNESSWLACSVLGP